DYVDGRNVRCAINRTLGRGAASRARMTGSCRRAETSGPRSHEAYIAGVERIVARANAFGFWAAPIVLAKRRPVAPAAVAPMISRVREPSSNEEPATHFVLSTTTAAPS